MIGEIPIHTTPNNIHPIYLYTKYNLNIAHAFEYNTRSKIDNYLIYVTVYIVIIFKVYFILLYTLCPFDSNSINQCDMCDMAM